MPFYIFMKLQIWFQSNTNLRVFEYIGVAKKLTIFIKIIKQAIIN